MTEARLVVDLAQVCANIETLRATIAPAEVMVVVKDDAYRHGVEAIVEAAASVGTAWFGSYDVETGCRVRDAAPDARVFAWATSTPAEIDRAAAAGLELGIGDADYLDVVAGVSRGRGIRVHLKIDSGLHRNGVRPENWAAFVRHAAELERRGDLAVAGIWSHLAEASDDEDDVAREVFVEAVAVAREAGLRPDVTHLAASAAGHARAEFRHDLVRFGAFVYGIRSTDGPDLPGLVPAASLRAHVTGVGDGVRIGIGSLDGLPSTLAGRVGVGTPGGTRALRSVGLAECSIEPWPGAAVGDEVAVFGPGGLGESSATTLAEAIGTVGEEILVRLSPRLPVSYVAR